MENDQDLSKFLNFSNYWDSILFPFLVLLSILAFLGFFGWDMFLRVYTFETAPSIKVRATITDKQGNDIYVASPDLPKKGDRIQANDYDAGRLRVNDSVCVQYQSISIGFPSNISEPQYGTELCNEENSNGDNPAPKDRNSGGKNG